MTTPLIPSRESQHTVTFNVNGAVPNVQQAREQAEINRIAQNKLPPPKPQAAQQPEGSSWDYLKPWKWTWFSNQAEPKAEVTIIYGPYGASKPLPQAPIPKPITSTKQEPKKPHKATHQPPTQSIVVSRQIVTFPVPPQPQAQTVRDERRQAGERDESEKNKQSQGQQPGVDQGNESQQIVPTSGGAAKPSPKKAVTAVARATSENMPKFPPMYFARDVEGQIQAVNKASTPVLAGLKETRLAKVVYSGLAAGLWVIDKFDAAVKKGTVVAEDAVALVSTVYDFPGYLQSYQKTLNAPKRLQESDNRIKAALNEPEFLELAKLARSTASNAVSEDIAKQIQEFLKDKPWFSNAKISKELIADLIQVNVGNVFANLADIIKKDPNYPKQNALVCLSSILSGRLGKYADQLAEIETAKVKAVQIYDAIKHLTIPNKDESQKILAQLLQPDDSGQVLNPQNSLILVRKLFPNYDTLSSDMKNKIATMITLGRKPIEQIKIFAHISEELITLFFPNKVNDLVFPGSTSNVAQMEGLQTFVNGLIKNQVYSFLLQSYGPMAKNPSRTNAWIGQIQNRIGNHSVETLMQAPTIFAKELAKSYILTNPDAISKLTLAIDGLTKQEDASLLRGKEQGVIPGLENRPLALYILKTLRSMLLTDDPTLLKAGASLQGLIADFTLGVVAKGSDLVIPKDERVAKDQFLNTVLDRAVEKFKSLTKSDKPLTDKEKQELVKKAETFWKSFVHDLPMPSFVGDMLVSMLTKRSDNYSQLLNVISTTHKDIETMYQDSLTKVRAYPKGPELVSLTEKIAQKMIETASAQLKNVEAIDTSALNIDDLFNEYLPGVKIDEGLKVWFKANIKALGTGLNRISPDSYAEAVRKGIQAVLLKSLVIVVEKNFQNDPKKFTAQLFHSLYEVFKNAFVRLNPKDKQALSEAWILQGKLKTLTAEYDSTKRELDKNKAILSHPNMLTELENQTIRNVVLLNDKFVRASDRTAALQNELNKKIQILNSADGTQWNLEKLLKIKEVLAYQKEKGIPSDLHSLETEKAKISNKISKDESDIASYELLIELRKLTPELKNVLKECLALEETLIMANDEERSIKNDLSRSKDLINTLRDETESPRDLATSIGAMEQIIALKSVLPNLASQMDELGATLDSKLKQFQVLSSGLTGIIGLDQGIHLLPEVLRKDSLIESAKKQQISRFLFEQFYPAMQPIFDKETNSAKLRDLTGSSLLGNITAIATKEILDAIPGLLFKPSKEKTFTLSEKIAKAIDTAIPGMTDLHTLIAPQLQAVVSGEDKALREGRDMLQNYIEGVLLKVLVRISEKNGPKHVLDNIAKKVNEFMASDDVKGLSKEKAAEMIADKILKDVIGIQSKEDLEGVFPVLKQLVFDKIKEQVRLQLSPFIMPLIDIENDRAKLEKISKGKFLGNLCTAITKDVMGWAVPRVLQDYKAVAEKMFKELAHRDPTEKQIVKLTGKIVKLVENAANKPTDPNHRPVALKNKALLQAFQEAAGLSLTPDQTKEYMVRIKEIKIKEELGYVLVTPESIIDSIVTAFPALATEKKELAAQLHKLTRLGTTSANRNITEFLQNYVEALMLKAFINIAKKNPPIPGKDVGLVLTEKLVDVVQAKLGDIREKVRMIDSRYEVELSRAKSEPAKQKVLKEKEMAIQKEVERTAQSIMPRIFKDVFGIDSPSSFEGIPLPIANIVYEMISNQIGDVVKKLVVSSYAGIKSLESPQQAVQEARTKLATQLGNNWGEVVCRDMSRMIVDSTIKNLNLSVGGQAKGVTQIGEGVRGYLEQLSRNNVEIAKVLLDYSKTPQLDRIVGQKLHDVQNMSEVDKAKAAEIVGNVLIQPVSRAIDKILTIEDTRKAEFNQKLATNFMNAAAEHLKFINLAKKRSVELRGNDNFTHEDFVAVAGDRLDAAVPRGKPGYSKSIANIVGRLKIDQLSNRQEADLKASIEKLVADDQDAVKVLREDLVVSEVERILGYSLSEAQIKRLNKKDKDGFTIKDIIRNEAEANIAQRTEHMYAPGMKSLMKTFFPNGKSDLTFVAPELRGQVWAQIKTHGPKIMQMLIESTLDQDTLTTIAIKSLEVMRDGKKLEPVLDEEPFDPAMSELDKASGALMLQAINMAKLPDRIVKLIIDPKTGEVFPDYQKTLGRVMRNQFNHDFVRRNLVTAFETMAERAKDGKPFFAAETREAGVVAQEKAKTRVEQEEKLDKLTHEVVDVTIDYQLKSQFKQFETKVNKWAEKTYKNVEQKAGWFGSIVNGIIGAFKFMYVKAVSGLFSIAHSVTSNNWIKKKIYEYINLDENKKIFMNAFRRPTVDQPGPSAYALYNENLLYKCIRGFQDALK